MHEPIDSLGVGKALCGEDDEDDYVDDDDDDDDDGLSKHTGDFASMPSFCLFIGLPYRNNETRVMVHSGRAAHSF